MPPKRFRKKFVPKAPTKASRRRLQPGIGTAVAAAGIIKKGWTEYSAYKAKKTKAANARKRANYANRLEASDNIVTVAPYVIGKQRKISFVEKVARAERPPSIFKRNYQFSAECQSGRKGWFSMEINQMNANDLQTDITTYKGMQTTDTASNNGTVASNSTLDGARFYVDYHREHIRMINSSSNSITGKIHLFAQKRDNDNSYGPDSVPITVINLMMQYSSVARPLVVNGLGGEQTVGNGWTFANAAASPPAGNNFQSVYNMPGSSINAAGICAATDPMLSPSSIHIKDEMNFWFRKVMSKPFSLKPGQQFNSSYVFNDLPKIFREQQDHVHLAGTSYSLVVEFQAGIVGDGTVTTGDGVVSTGSGQLSVIRESTRILGLENYLKSKVVLQTTPMAQITAAQQIIINADSGVMDTGVELDT